MVIPLARWDANIGLTKARLLHPDCLEHSVSSVVSDQFNSFGGIAGCIGQSLCCLNISLVPMETGKPSREDRTQQALVIGLVNPEHPNGI